MTLENDIREWVKIDNQIKLLKDQMNILKESRKSYTHKILTCDNDLENTTIQISDGRLRIQNVKHTQPLTLKFISTCLTECISDENYSKQIFEYIKKKREIKYSYDIKRYYSKTN